MNSLFVTIALIALVDSINPNAMAVQVYLLSTPNPVKRSLFFILGDFTAAIVAGVVLLFGVARQIIPWLDQLGSLLLVIQLILGIALVWLGWNMTRLMQKPQVKRPLSLNPIHTFTFGLTMALIEAPTALPFLAALDRIARANVSVSVAIAALTFYSVIFVLPLVMLLLVYITLKNRASTAIFKVQKIIARWFPEAFRIMLVLMGVILIADSIAHSVGLSLI